MSTRFNGRVQDEDKAKWACVGPEEATVGIGPSSSSDRLISSILPKCHFSLNDDKNCDAIAIAATSTSTTGPFPYDAAQSTRQTAPILVERNKPVVLSRHRQLKDDAYVRLTSSEEEHGILNDERPHYRIWIESNTDCRVVAFWFMGLLNNIPYVIMLAGAKDIAEGGTALVFVANILPTLLVKLSAPFWFPWVTYGKRILSASILFAVSFLVVAYFSTQFEHDYEAYGESQSNNNEEQEKTSAANEKRDVGFELVGVMLGSLACGMGEASLLALAGRFAAAEPFNCVNTDVMITGTPANSSSAPQEGPMEGRGMECQLSQQVEHSPKIHVPHKRSKRAFLTAFSSGTGIAGVLGYAYVTFFHYWMKLSFSLILIMANVFPLAYSLIFFLCLGEGPESSSNMLQSFLDKRSCSRDALLETNEVNHGEDSFYEEEDTVIASRNSIGCLSAIVHESNSVTKTGVFEMQNHASQTIPPWTTINEANTKETMERDNEQKRRDYQTVNDACSHGESSFANAVSLSESPRESEVKEVRSMSGWEKARLVLSLWPYTIPLFLVYAAEYALQSGTWTAIGFPVDSEKSRDLFYEYSNWMYQIGVFLSRSSGTLFQASISFLWLMPMLQIGNLILFMWTAITHVWYDYSLLIMCFFAGCLGGGVYVNAFTRISADLPPSHVEFALSSASVADSFGILLADISGLYIQSCLYAHNNLSGATVKCPV